MEPADFQHGYKSRAPAIRAIPARKKPSVPDGEQTA
jgi:hypothetical protein